MVHEYMIVCHITKDGQAGYTRFFVKHIGAVTKETIMGWEQVCEEVGGYDKAIVLHWQEIYGTGHMEENQDG